MFGYILALCMALLLLVACLAGLGRAGSRPAGRRRRPNRRNRKIPRRMSPRRIVPSPPLAGGAAAAGTPRPPENSDPAMPSSGSRALWQNSASGASPAAWRATPARKSWWWAPGWPVSPPLICWPRGPVGDRPGCRSGGGGETGRTTAHLTCALDASYLELERRHGQLAAGWPPTVRSRPSMR